MRRKETVCTSKYILWQIKTRNHSYVTNLGRQHANKKEKLRIAEKFEDSEARPSFFGWSTRASAVNEPLISGVRNHGDE